MISEATQVEKSVVVMVSDDASEICIAVGNRTRCLVKYSSFAVTYRVIVIFIAKI